MKKITFLFAFFLSLLGGTQAWAQVTESFEEWPSSTVADGWLLINTATYGQTYSYDYVVSNDYAASSGTKTLWNTNHNSSGSLSSPMIVTPSMTGTLTFKYKKYNTSSSTKGYIDIFVYDEATSSATGTAVWRAYPNSPSNEAVSKYNLASYNVGDSPKRLAIYISDVCIDEFTYTPYKTLEGPALTVKDGSAKVTSPYAYDFGLTTEGTEKVFTLSNPGTAAVEGLSVSKTGSFDATLSATSIAAGGEATLTLTMPATTGSSAITISSTTEGIADFVINVSGTIRDPNKVYLDFSDGTIPDGWTSVAIGSYASSYGTPWTASTGYVGQSGTSSSYEWAFTSPKMVFSENETIIFETQKYTSSTWYNPSITVQYKTEDGEWTTVGSTYTDDTYDTWTKRSVTIPTADAKYIRFTGWYVKLRNIYGGKLPDGAKFAINTDGTAQDYGMVMKDASATKTFTITNTGNAALEVTFAPSTGFSTVPTSLNVAAGASETFDVVMNTTTPGAKSGNVVLSFTATNATEFTIPVTGYVADPDKIYADFNDNQLPTGWSDDGGWTYSDGKAVAGMDTQMTLPALTVAEGEKLAISVMSTGNNQELFYYTSTDGGSTWSVKSSNLASSITTSAYSVVYIEGLAAGNYKIRLQGYRVSIDAINGFTLNADAPALTVDPTTAADFGKVKAQPAAKTYTITNSGTGTLTGTIESSDTDKFTVSESSFSLGAGENMTFDVALVFDENYGEKTATITVHPENDGLVDVVINATATTADPNIWEEDFESGIPASWINENNAWTTTSYSHEGQAGPRYNKTYTLTTPRLQATKDQVLTFDVIDAESETYFLKAEYSTDRTNWNLIENYITGGNKSFTAPADGYYWLRFTGNYTFVDNFLGFKLAPLAHDAAITAKNIPATGNQYVEYTASVDVKEMAGKAESGVVAKLYVDGVEKASDTKDLIANGTATFTMTFTPDVAIDAKKAYIKVSYEDVELTTDEIDLTIAAATVLDEADGLPAGLETGTNASVVLKYTAKNGWNTIAVPFALTDKILTSIFGPGWKAYQLNGFTDNTLSFESTTTFYAGYPYLVYVEAAATHAEGVKLFGLNISTTNENYDTKNGVTFQTTYAGIKAGAMTDDWYGVTSAGEIRKAGSSALLKGFRAYFTGAVAGARISVDGDGIVTGINSIDAINNVEGVYNLNGQKVERLQKGLYIVNGKKVVKK